MKIKLISKLEKKIILPNKLIITSVSINTNVNMMNAEKYKCNI